MNKVVLLGVDRLDWNVLQVFIDKGLLPTFQKLLEAGASGPVIGQIPQFSSVGWTTLLTGVDPLFHGILHDLEYGPGGISARSSTAKNVRVPRVWDYVSQSGLTSHLLGWPALSKSSLERGIYVVNGVQQIEAAAIDIWPLAPESVHPLSWREHVLDYRVFPDDIPQHYLDQILQFIPPQEREELLIPCRLLFSQLLSLHSIGMRLAEETTSDWQLLALRFDTFVQISELPLQLSFTGNTLSYLLGWYQFFDGMLAQYLSYLGDNDYLMLVSDQGVNPALIGRPTGLATPAGSGALLMKGPDIIPDHLLEGISLYDVAPTLLAMMGLKAHVEMLGKVLFDPQRPLQNNPHAQNLPLQISQHEIQPPMQDKEACDAKLAALGFGAVDLSGLEYVTDTLYSEILFEVAQAHYRNENFETSAQMAKRSLELRPDVIPVIILLCRALLALGRVDECRQIIDQYKSIDIGPIWTDIVSGMFAIGAEDWLLARESFTRLCRYEGGPVNAPLWLAESLIRLGKLGEARAQLELATAWPIEIEMAWSRLAFVYRQLNEHEKALAAIQTAISLQPANARFLIFRFELLAALGQFAAAKADLLRAIQLDATVISEKHANAILLSAYHQQGQDQIFELVKF